MNVIRRKNSWPKQNLVVVSDTPNMHMLLRELIRAMNWVVVEATTHAHQALSSIKQGHAQLLVVDDTLKYPSSRVLRTLMTDPIAVLTPTLSFIHEQTKPESSVLLGMGKPVLVEKPLTPSKFLPAFSQLTRDWEKEPFQTLRFTTYELLNGNSNKAIKDLKKLLQFNETLPFVACSIGIYLRRSGRFREAESLLLAALKKTPRSIALMLNLVDLYRLAGAPQLAHKILVTANASFSAPMALLPDLIQVALMQGDVKEAVRHLYQLLKSGINVEETTDFLARCLLSLGRHNEAEKLFGMNKSSFKRLLNAWNAAEGVQVQQIAG